MFIGMIHWLAHWIWAVVIRKSCRTSFTNWSEMRLQGCLAFYFQQNACLPEINNEVLVVLKLLRVGDYTGIYGSDEQRSERPEHQGEGERGIKRSKIVEKLERDLSLSSLPKKRRAFVVKKLTAVLFCCRKQQKLCSFYCHGAEQVQLQKWTLTSLPLASLFTEQ